MHFGDYELGMALDRAAWPVSLEEHAERCRDCRAVLDRARESHSRIGAVLGLLDHPAQAVSFAAIEARALASLPHALAPLPSIDDTSELESRPIPVLPFRDPVSFWNPRAADRRRIAWRRGIVGFLLAAGAAAAAVPAAPPMRHFVVSLFQPRAHQQPQATQNPQSAVSAPAVASVERGVTIAPRSGKAVVVWRARQPGSVIRVNVQTAGKSPDSHVSVLANGEGVVYGVSADTMFVDNRGARGVSFDVDVPAPSERTAVTLIVVDRPVFSRRGRTVATDTPRSSDGSYAIDLAAPVRTK